MDRVPDEIIGEILSRIANAGEVVVASTTCKKWRRAMLFHLKSLAFYADHFRIYHALEVETIITRTILQTNRLESLSIGYDFGCHDDVDVEFSADRVHSWLMHVKDTLRELCLFVEIHPRINIFEKCQWNKLEVLELGHFCFSGVELSDMTSFPCLKKLLLEDVELSALQLSNFIALCPLIEYLRLVSVDVGMTASLELFINTLEMIDVVSMSLERFILVADHLESLRFQWCEFELFKLVGNEALKDLNIDVSIISNFDVGVNIKSLENVEGPMLYRMISKSSNLRRLRLWTVNGDDCYGFDNLQKISASFPRLVHLSLYCNEEVSLSLPGSFLLQNVATLELGFVSYRHFSSSVRAFLDKCPNLKKVVVHLIYQRKDTSGALRESLSEFSSSLVQLGREYLHVEFEFKYE